MKTLYVSDLDGTLLRSDATLSTYTAETVNALVKRGMLFSYATARSNYTAGSITVALEKSLPVIVYNGTFILENGTGCILLSNSFAAQDAAQVWRTFAAGGVYPFVYSHIGGAERASYLPDCLSPDMQGFAATRTEDKRMRPCVEESVLEGEVFHFVAMDCAERLLPIYEALRVTYPCYYTIDMYTKSPWLEVYPLGVSKANAVLQLKTLLGCDRVVCFGDGKNDISMFEVADECYAVENAASELKAIATAVIGNNNDDAVAKWLLEKENTYAD